MNPTKNFQSIIMKLQDFWDKQGCLIWQPYYSQVGAGTYNPATFLRALGPEPWNVAYVEPSIRPDDGRYGENPNRMQMHYQFQVILKPDPGNPQEIYLKSLEAIGINPHEHDIRFVEDNWESPALGAWGLGWEVWLDGQEITQFTYFQQAGGLQLDPVSVELTYGLERIAMALQRVDNFVDIQWSPTLTDGDVNLQAEQEHSKYYFEIADVDRMREMYNLFEEEANACLDQGLVLPAYDYVLKCSHTFNVLDTRGAIGVTERQAFFGRMRRLSRRVSEAYLEQRQHLEYPWLDESDIPGMQQATNKTQGKQVHKPEATDAGITYKPFLLEIGTEEIPVGDLDKALEQLIEMVPTMLKRLRLEHGTVQISGTPRRLVVSIQELASMQAEEEMVVKGPPANRAYDSDGMPTKAALGFARGKGVDVDELEIREFDGGHYVTAVVRHSGLSVSQVLSEELPGLIGAIRFNKPMRWNSSNISFSRPIRWLLALHGEKVVPFSYAGIHSGNMTRGLRFQEPEEILIASAQNYFDVLAEQNIILDVDKRKGMIYEQINELAASINGKIIEDMELLSEVTNLVESPISLLGTFDPSFLELPREVLISVMKKHQRYFPVERNDREYPGGNAELLPNFIAVRNGNEKHLDIVTAGNEHVIRARFADAAYFVREDIKKPLEAYLPKLSTLTFQVDLGSMLDKTERIQALTTYLSNVFQLEDYEIETATRVAQLCKADLATQMVVEMTSLQGVMGSYYALASGESEAIAEGIREHYLPRFTGDTFPETTQGFAVGLADRVDTLVGLFSAGLEPTGNRDPYAQRRAALGLVQMLISKKVEIDLCTAIREAARELPIQSSDESQAQVEIFIIERLRNMLLEQGEKFDIVDAVLRAQGHNPWGAYQAVQALKNWVTRDDWGSILPAYSRCVRITRDLKVKYAVQTEMLEEAAEIELFNNLLKAEETERNEGSIDDFLNAFVPMIPAVDTFFEEVLVMVEDEQIRQNRLGILQRIAAIADGVVDMSRLEGF